MIQGNLNNMILMNLVLIWLITKTSKAKDKTGSSYSDWANVTRSIPRDLFWGLYFAIL